MTLTRICTLSTSSFFHFDPKNLDYHRPIGYDEELARVIATATAAKEVLPDVLVAAPSTCSWWYCTFHTFEIFMTLTSPLDWTSQIGWNDTAAHYNIDFLPWFLGQMAAEETKNGKRLLDYLDIHYYFQPDTSANDDAAKALRLRMTRSLWVRMWYLVSTKAYIPNSFRIRPMLMNLG